MHEKSEKTTLEQQVLVDGMSKCTVSIVFYTKRLRKTDIQV